MRINLLTLVLAPAIVLLSPSVLMADNVFTDPAETALLKTLEYATQQQWQSATQQAQNITEQYPTFAAGKQLLTLIQNKQIPKQTEAPLIKPWTNEYTHANLNAELTKRWKFAEQSIDLNKKPASIIQLADNIQHAIVIETETSRAYVFKNTQGQPDYIGDFYIAIGKLGIGKDKRGKQKEGDHLTPIGIYKIDSYRPDSTLQEIYGVGALTLDYPNGLDRKRDKTGYGIWLHGVPRDTYSRPPNSSRGCVTMNNDIFSQLKPYIEINKTPVIITDKIKWVDKNIQQTVFAELFQWQTDWQAINTDNYLQHYADNFKKNKHELQKWQQYKKNINAAKTYINVHIKHLSLYRYPQEENMLVSHFEQHYQSNNFNSMSNKEIIWQKQSDSYKIILERRL